MGGIAGWMALPRHAPEDASMAGVLEAIVHRGPQAARACVLASRTSRIVLGHRALDAGAAAEPLYDPEAGLAAAIDGGEARALREAYRRGETEALKELRGAFAFALWDAKRERLVLARDRMGEKPLYYCESNGSVFFASEPKALLKIPGIRAQTDFHAVRELLGFGYVPAPRSLFGGIRRLAAGTYVAWQHGRRREVRYWIPPDREPPAQRAAGRDAVGDFVSGLDAVVKEQAADSVLVDGTPDASVLLALLARHRGALKTFAVGLEGAPPDALALAGEAAKHFGAQHHELTLTRAQLVDALPKVIAYLDAPLAEPGDIALHLLAREAARTSSAIVMPEGGDALLGGRPWHVCERLGWPLARGDWRRRFLVRAGGLAAAACERLAGPVLNGAPVLEAKPPFDAAPGTSALRRALYFEQASVLPDKVLERVARLAMAASVEARMSFADHRLAELVSALPDAARVRGWRGKWILREAARRLLPRPLRKAPRRRLALPLGDWLRKDLRAMLLDHLHGHGSLVRAYFNPAALDRVLTEHLQGRQDHQQLLWTLLNLEIWQRTYRPG